MTDKTDPFLSIKINGLEAVKEMLEKLPGEVREKISKSALNKSAKLVAEEVKRRVPVKTGLLFTSIKIRRTPKDPTKIQVTAGDKLAWYAHLVEYGFNHTSHGPRGSRKMTKAGRIDGKNFMRDSAQAQFEPVVDTVQEVVADQVQRAYQKNSSPENL